MAGKVLKIGIGILGGEILHTLARAGVDEIIVACRDEAKGKQKAAQVAMGAAAQGLYPNISYRKIDLNNVEETTRILSEVEPDMVFNSADLYPFWRFHTDLPRDVAKRLGEGGPVGYSLALPFRLLLLYRLMKAVKASGTDAHVLFTNDPCEIISPMLAGAGLAPTTGIGDFAHIIEPMRRVVSAKTGVHIKDVEVYLVADFATYHLLRRKIAPQKSMYFLKVIAGGSIVTDRWDPIEILSAAVEESRSKGRKSPIADQHYTASIAVGDMMAILGDTGEIRHCPGPAGLQGGFPVRLNANGAEVVLPEEITLDEAIGMNAEAQKLEGIERVTGDGTVVFTDEAVRIMDEEMELNLKSFNVTECEKVVEYFWHAYRALVRRYKDKPKSLEF
ncbi:hypothetical protein CL673_07755 [Candidatus Bathyarchaeota archaeon]|nr:hypothetical protein [Candidatus Bathyarchaeota archaeon]